MTTSMTRERKHVNCRDAVVSEDGRVGMVHTIGVRKCYVQFGSGGPIEYLYIKSLRHATENEVMVSGRDGVGMVIRT